MEHVRYIDRTRDYYLSQGYEKSYEWAHFNDVPFTPLAKRLAECKVGLLGTSEVAVHFDLETEEKKIILKLTIQELKTFILLKLNF